MGKKGQKAWNKINTNEQDIAHLYIDERLTAKQISDRLGIGVGTIYDRLKKVGVMRSNSEAHKGMTPSNYRGWYIEGRSGYKVIEISPDDPYVCMATKLNGGKRLYVREHRLKMARKLGRPLERWEIVHHKNHNKSDNRVSNLELFPNQSQHQAETIKHNEMLRMKSEIERLTSELETCRAALKSVEARAKF